jgi:acyl carrier protein
MAVIELVYLIEETFNLQIPDEDLAGLTSVEHVVHYIEGRVKSSEASTAQAMKGTALSKAAVPKASAAKPSSKKVKKRS